MKNVFLALTVFLSTGIVTTASASGIPGVCTTSLTPQNVDRTGKTYLCCLDRTGIVYCPDYPRS